LHERFVLFATVVLGEVEARTVPVSATRTDALSTSILNHTKLTPSYHGRPDL